MGNEGLPVTARRLAEITRLRGTSGASALVREATGGLAVRWHFRLPFCSGSRWAANALAYSLEGMLRTLDANVTSRRSDIVVSLTTDPGADAQDLLGRVVAAAVSPDLGGAVHRAAERDALRRSQLRDAALDAALRRIFPEEPDSWLLPDPPPSAPDVLEECAATLCDPAHWEIVSVGTRAWDAVATWVDPQLVGAHYATSGPSEPRPRIQPLHFASATGHPWASVRLAAYMPPLGPQAAAWATAAVALRRRLESRVRYLSYVLDVVPDPVYRIILLVAEPSASRVSSLLEAVAHGIADFCAKPPILGEVASARNRTLLDWAVRLDSIDGFADVLSELVATNRSVSDLCGFLSTVGMIDTIHCRELCINRFTGIVMGDPGRVCPDSWNGAYLRALC